MSKKLKQAAMPIYMEVGGDSIRDSWWLVNHHYCLIHSHDLVSVVNKSANKISLHSSKLPVIQSFLGLCLEVMTLSEECTCRMWMTGLWGSYVPGTASSKSRHISSLGDTYWSSREVNWNANKATQQISKWVIEALTERSNWLVEPVILKMKY